MRLREIDLSFEIIVALRKNPRCDVVLLRARGFLDMDGIS